MYIIKRLLLKYISENKDLLPPGVTIPGINIMDPIDVVAESGTCVCNQSSGSDCVVSGDLEIKREFTGRAKRYCNNPSDDNYEECPSSHPHEIEITEADDEWAWRRGALIGGGCDCDGLSSSPCKLCARFKDVRVPNICGTENARCIGTATDTSKTCDIDTSTGDCPEGCDRMGTRETCQGDGIDSIVGVGKWGTPSTLYYVTPDYKYKGTALESRTDISPALKRGMETHFYDRKPMCKWNPHR